MAKLTSQQRDYFTKRINDQFATHLGPLEKNAALKKADFVNEQFDIFVENLGIKKNLEELQEALIHIQTARQAVANIMSNLCKQYDIKISSYASDRYEWNWSNYRDDMIEVKDKLMEMCRKECEEAFKQFPEGAEIERLKSKKREALDYIMGYDQSKELLDGLSVVLTGSGVAMLEEYKEAK